MPQHYQQTLSAACPQSYGHVLVQVACALTARVLPMWMVPRSEGHLRHAPLLQQVKKIFCFLNQNVDFEIYGSWGPLDSFKILSRGAPTFSTPGKAIPRLFEKSIFWVPTGLGPSGQGSMGPMGMGPWAQVRAGPRPNGQGPMGPGRTRAQWAWGHGPGPGPDPGPKWARAHGLGPGPDPGQWAI